MLHLTPHQNVQMDDLLSSLLPSGVDGQVSIVDLPDVTQVKFTLRGPGKIDAAYKLEDQVSSCLQFNKYCTK
jgi:hypothetical protein